ARDVAEREKKKQQIKRAYFELNQIMNITIPMCVIDTNHNIIRINNTFASMLESESKELAGKKCYDVVPGPFCNTPKCTVTQILNGEEQWNYEKVLKLRNGSEVICNMKAVPYRDLNGKICGVIQNYVDITDRKKAEKLIKNIAKFPSENPNPVFRTNNEKILYANKIAQQILGISNNDSIPVDFQEYVKKSLKNDNIIKLELELNNHIYSFVIRSFKKLGYSNVYGRDITDQKNAETTLQTRNEEISALLNASKVVLKNSKFKETSKLIFKSYASLIKISEGFIGLLSPDKKFIKFHLLYLNGAIKELETPPSHPIGCFLSEVVKTKKVEFFNEGLNIEWKMFLPGTHFKLKNVILIPLIINDEVKGLVGLINKHTQFIETDVNLANAFAEIVSIAYRNSQILESLEESNKTYQSLSNELEQRVEDRTRKLKKSEERLRNLINNLSDVVIEHDIDGKITFLSPQIFSIIGFHPSELIGRLFLDLIHPDDRDIYKNVIVKINNPGDIFTQELGIKHKKGYYLPISIKGSLVYTNNQNRIIAVISDITEQKLIDDMLKKEIKKLKELEQIRGDLVRRISHELKTPLISIFSGSEYLLSHFENIENNEFKNMLKFIYKGGYRLKSLVNNLITAYDIESNEILLSIKQENVTPIIQDCIEDLIHQANKRKIFINTSLPRELFINIDKSRISHAISNVLSNAIKNTPLNGNIFIKVHTHTNYADIIVKDDGIGLTAKEITFLFKKFGKIERYGKGMDVDIEGAGLGLYISNEIVKLHKGEIIIKSRGRNKGCKVIIRLKR
ncbi:MAG: PAS domain S-box protein, partial [Candidatus Lokiarchaeota archaeon]